MNAYWRDLIKFLLQTCPLGWAAVALFGYGTGQWEMLGFIEDTAIWIGYWFIAYQFFRHSSGNSPASMSCTLMVVIFGACSVNGYLMHSLDYLNGKMLMELSLGQYIRCFTMVPLIAVTWRFAIREEVKLIAKQLSDVAKAVTAALREGEAHG